MKRIATLFAVVTAVTMVALPTHASGAVPQKGVLLKGTLYATSQAALPKRVQLKVAATGSNARFTWWCGTGRPPTALTVAIKPDGSFAGAVGTGSLTIWAVKGRFLTATSAQASLRLATACDGKGGTVNLKPA